VVERKDCIEKKKVSRERNIDRGRFKVSCFTTLRKISMERQRKREAEMQSA
jgi:hypothetical protein